MPLTDEVLIYGLAFSSAGCGAVCVQPLVTRVASAMRRRADTYQQAKLERAAKELDEIFLEVKPTWLKLAYGIAPLALGLGIYAFTHNLLFTVLGAAAGPVLPDLWLRRQKAVRKEQFHNQLVDALFILSSSLRAGLSLMQAFEQLATEMTPPASQEFGLVIKAHRLGRTLEGSLEGLNDRIRSDELRLITTAILLARETGGDVTNIIKQLITTIRERKKLNDKVSALTIQGRLQAYIMSILPIAFAFFVRSFNHEYFDQMLADRTGQMLLALSGVLWVVGIILLIIMSRVDY